MEASEVAAGYSFIYDDYIYDVHAKLLVPAENDNSLHKRALCQTLCILDIIQWILQSLAHNVLPSHLCCTTCGRLICDVLVAVRSIVHVQWNML